MSTPTPQDGAAPASLDLEAIELAMSTVGGDSMQKVLGSIRPLIAEVRRLLAVDACTEFSHVLNEERTGCRCGFFDANRDLANLAAPLESPRPTTAPAVDLTKEIAAIRTYIAKSALYYLDEGKPKRKEAHEMAEWGLSRIQHYTRPAAPQEESRGEPGRQIVSCALLSMPKDPVKRAAMIHAMAGDRCPDCEANLLLWEGTHTSNLLGPTIIYRDWEAEEQAKDCQKCFGLGRVNFRNTSPTGAPEEAPSPAPAAQGPITEEEIERMAAMAVEDGIAIDRSMRQAPQSKPMEPAPARAFYPHKIYLDAGTRRWWLSGESDEQGPIEDRFQGYEIYGTRPAEAPKPAPMEVQVPDDNESLDPRYGKPHPMSIMKCPYISIEGTPYLVQSAVWEVIGQQHHSLMENHRIIRTIRASLRALCEGLKIENLEAALESTPENLKWLGQQIRERAEAGVRDMHTKEAKPIHEAPREWMVMGEHTPDGYWIVEEPPMGPNKIRVREVLRDEGASPESSTIPNPRVAAPPSPDLDMKAEMLNLGAAYGSNLILIHDLRKAAEQGMRAINQTQAAIAKGQAAWPYVGRLLGAAFRELEAQVTRAKDRPPSPETPAAISLLDGYALRHPDRPCPIVFSDPEDAWKYFHDQFEKDALVGPKEAWTVYPIYRSVLPPQEKA